MNKENEIQLLSNVQTLLSQNPDANQREMAKTVEMSLGMTNALLKKFAEKGWICMQRLSSRNIRYALTPAGMNEVAHRSYRFIKQTFASLNEYKDRITKLVLDSKKDGFSQILLIGNSEVAFLVEYACQTLSMDYKNISEQDFLLNKQILKSPSSNTLYVFSDNTFFENNIKSSSDTSYEIPSNFISIMVFLAN